MAAPSSTILTLDAKDPTLCSIINGKDILITGGTGSFGNRMVRTLLYEFSPRRIIVYSRDELKQSVMQEDLLEECISRGFPERFEILRFFIGCIRDSDRLNQAFYGVHVVIHAAALKQVPAIEYNPFEAVKTNILGANAVIQAAVKCGVKRLLALSTDKAAAPANLYGATKLCQDKLMVSSNFMYQNRVSVAVVRYGNVFASRGSVVPFFLKQSSTGMLTITDENMTRFTITLDEGVAFSLNCLKQMMGGEIYIPKIPSYKITTIANAISQIKKTEVKITGIRPGEKLHEVMVPRDEAANTLEFPEFFVITPRGNWFNSKKDQYVQQGGIVKVNDFEYSSDTNDTWVNEDYILKQLQAHKLVN